MGKLKILIVGAGGREHALAWTISQSKQVEELYIAPGNAGTAQLGINVEIAADNIGALVDFAVNGAIDLVVVGPEVPLALGLVDALQEQGIRAFGPTQAAAELEASKAFSKAFMQAHGIPTAQYASFDTYAEAKAYLDQQSAPIVIKADGLAAGKGVIICENMQQAQDALSEIMQDRAFGEAGNKVVIEEFMNGPEVSVLAFSDGQTVVTMPPARDHKRVFDNDEGPNTGGMGAFTPPADVSPELVDQIKNTVIQPTIDGMRKAGTPFVGVLYAGLMLTPNGHRVLEFNVRFGDPETQVILPMLDTDIIDIMQACIDGRLSEMDVQWKDGACATVVAASPGYPGSYPKGLPITIRDAENLLIFHAGTAFEVDVLVTSGGRVLAVSGLGDTLDEALKVAYEGMEHVWFDGIHYRKDIGRKNTQ